MGETYASTPNTIEEIREKINQYKNDVKYKKLIFDFEGEEKKDVEWMINALFFSPFQLTDEDINRRILLYAETVGSFSKNREYLPVFIPIFLDKNLTDENREHIATINKIAKEHNEHLPEKWADFITLIRKNMIDPVATEKSCKEQVQRCEVYMKKAEAEKQALIDENNNLKAKIEKGFMPKEEETRVFNEKSFKKYTVDILKLMKSANLDPDKRTACLNLAKTCYNLNFEPKYVVSVCMHHEVKADMICEYATITDKRLLLYLTKNHKSTLDTINAKKLFSMRFSIEEIEEMLNSMDASELMDFLNSVEFREDDSKWPDVPIEDEEIEESDTVSNEDAEMDDFYNALNDAIGAKVEKIRVQKNEPKKWAEHPVDMEFNVDISDDDAADEEASGDSESSVHENDDDYVEEYYDDYSGGGGSPDIAFFDDGPDMYNSPSDNFNFDVSDGPSNAPGDENNTVDTSDAYTTDGSSRGVLDDDTDIPNVENSDYFKDKRIKTNNGKY